jgi:hypothetical protein
VTCDALLPKPEVTQLARRIDIGIGAAKRRHWDNAFGHMPLGPGNHDCSNLFSTVRERMTGRL